MPGRLVGRETARRLKCCPSRDWAVVCVAKRCRFGGTKTNSCSLFSFLPSSFILLLPHKLQLFTSRSFVHCFLKISLQPFRYYPKASRSFKFTPFRFQITVPIFSQSSDSLYCQLSQIATPKPDLHSPKLQRLLIVSGSWATIKARER